MKKIIHIFLFLIVIAFFACETQEPPVPDFEDVVKFTIYDYLLENEEQYSSFISILQKGNLDKTLSAYNPEGTDYTLFLPDNDAIDRFIEANSQVSSLNDILNLDGGEYAEQFAKYHVVQLGIRSDNFPFGAFPEPTLSEDFLTVSFIVESDTSYYKINNQASVSFPDIETNNGFIHLIETALTPINFTTYDWLELNSGYSIFKEAVDLTGFDVELNQNIKSSDTIQPFTLLVESNEVYNDFNIYSIEDLISRISPNEQDYTSDSNPLHNFVAYHILTGDFYVDDFEGTNTNYSTLSDIPLRIDGTGIDFIINDGKEVFDTIIVQGDTTFIDHIGFLYDESNVITQSGVIHMIDKLMKQQPPSRAIRTFQFGEELAFRELRLKPATYLIDDEYDLNVLDWTGTDLYFVELGDQETSAWGGDYLEMDGDFEISYQIPKIIQGNYEMFIGVEMFSRQNAVIEVFIDGNKIGGFIDLTNGGNATSPFQMNLIGTVNFSAYQSHTITIRSLIPGRFLWDYIRFEPI